MGIGTHQNSAKQALPLVSIPLEVLGVLGAAALALRRFRSPPEFLSAAPELLSAADVKRCRMPLLGILYSATRTSSAHRCFVIIAWSETRTRTTKNSRGPRGPHVGPNRALEVFEKLLVAQ